MSGDASPVTVTKVSKSFAATPVLDSVSLDVPSGSVTALLGPSGCGKTTLLRVIAGLERPDSGEVRVGDRLLTGQGAFVAPEHRRVGMVFQDWALFPHLTVAGNVGYGLPRSDRRSGRVEEALEMVGLAGMGQRWPATLSGGQQQRVALARALAPRPAVLLLDEPFSNLDTALRTTVRGEVHRLLRQLGVTTVFVTHDQEEAFLLGDEVAVMAEGSLVQSGRPEDLYAAPVSPWVAGFVGEANLLPGTAREDRADTPLGTVPLAFPVDGRVSVLVRPEQVQVHAGEGARVEAVEFYGHDSVYLVRLENGPVLRARVGAAPAFRDGDRVSVSYSGPPTVAYRA